MITLILGPINSGTTIKLLELSNNVIDNKIIITHTSNTNDTFILKMDYLVKDINKFIKYKNIFIIEGHLFVDLYKFITMMTNVNIYISSSAMNKDIIKIIPYSHNIIKCNSLCSNCKDQYAVFNSKSLCPKCFDTKVSLKNMFNINFYTFDYIYVSPDLTVQETYVSVDDPLYKKIINTKINIVPVNEYINFKITYNEDSLTFTMINYKITFLRLLYLLNNQLSFYNFNQKNIPNEINIIYLHNAEIILAIINTFDNNILDNIGDIKLSDLNNLKLLDNIKILDNIKLLELDNIKLLNNIKSLDNIKISHDSKLYNLDNNYDLSNSIVLNYNEHFNNKVGLIKLYDF